MRRAAALAAVLLAAAALGCALPARAQRITGEILLDACSARLDRRSNVEGALCLGAIAGALDAHDGLLPKDETMYCLNGQRVTNDHVVRVVVDWLRRNPAQQARPAGMAVIFAMRDAYPCAPADGAAAKP